MVPFDTLVVTTARFFLPELARQYRQTQSPPRALEKADLNRLIRRAQQEAT